MRELAIICYYLLCGFTSVQFPTSTVAAPSRRISVSMGLPGTVPAEIQRLLPFCYDGRKWQLAVVPVLKKQFWIDLGLGGGVDASGRNPYQVIGLIESSLNDSFQEKGLIP